MAFGAGLGYARKVYNNPSAFTEQMRYENWATRYDLYWSYFIGSALENMGTWAGYRSENGLYYGTRNIYNPARRLVDFYAGTVYPGTLTADAERFEDGTVIAMPFAKDTSKEITRAIASLWKWSNWHIGKNIMVTFAATTGECLVEIIDDLDSRKMEFRNWYPSTITNVDLDFRGNVKGYTIEYNYEEFEGRDQYGSAMSRTYHYKKVVDEFEFRTYRDNEPYGYDGNESVWPNPYGFVPAVWVKHNDVGTQHGEPCMRYLGKWEQLNSLASHWNDQAHRVLQAPILITGDNISTLKTDTPDDLKPNPVNPSAARQQIPILRGPVGADLITATPPSGDVIAVIDHMIEEIEKDHPELTMYHEMRGLSQITGPGVSRLFGDVEIMVNKARASYDTQMVKLHQMSIAIGGYRANAGDWGSVSALSYDREVFLPFNLDSYENGELDFEIAARPLVPNGHWEAVQVMRSEMALEREKIMLAQLKANPNPDGEGAGGQPSGEMANQIGLRLRMRTATEGALATTNPPSP